MVGVRQSHSAKRERPAHTHRLSLSVGDEEANGQELVACESSSPPLSTHATIVPFPFTTLLRPSPRPAPHDMPTEKQAGAPRPPSSCCKPHHQIMTDPTTTTTPDAGVDVDALAAAVTKQGGVVKTLKKEGAKPEVLEPEVAKLVALRAELDVARKAAEGTSTEKPFNRAAFDDLVKRKMFVVSAFEIHGGVGGLFDLGPASCALKANILDVWRQHFVLEENMLEMECTCLTPEVVLKTSGHVDKFTDLMVKDEVTGECHRADKLLEDFIDKFLETNPTLTRDQQEEHRRVQRQADAYTPEELHALFQKYGITSPSTGNPLTFPFAFNLMFKTSIGPEGIATGYLRPETAQGLFVNFRRLLEYNSGRMPFAAAQIGLGFRNEISPRAGLLRVREFCMAEIEHFVNPLDKKHPKFASLADTSLVLFPNEDQLGSGKTKVMTIGEAVREGVVNNETLGYFMAKTWLFMLKVGMDGGRLRFRQHLKTEMAHYAADCWDLEIKSSYGWVECVGHADRACYDLMVHSKKSKVPLVASYTLPEPREEEVWVMKAEKAVIGKTFKQEQKKVMAALEGLTEEGGEGVEGFQKQLEEEGSAVLEGCRIEKGMVSWTKVKKMVQEVKYMPSVIEPSFGIGRVLYSLMEHSFTQRKADENRCVMAFLPRVAPIKVGVYPLLNKPDFVPYTERIVSLLTEAGLSNRSDTTGVSVGRRYSRADEIGCPFGVTIDYETLLSQDVTVRERDSTAQIRVRIEQLVPLLKGLVDGSKSWEKDAMGKFPVVRTGEEEGEEEGEGGGDGGAAVGAGAVTVVEKTPRGRFSRPAEAAGLPDIGKLSMK